MTVIDEEVREGSEEGSSPPEPQPVNPTRRGAQRAKSLTRAAFTALTAFWAVVTLRSRKTGARVAAVVNGPGSLVHDRLPTFAEAWARQCECARHYKTAMWCPWLQYPRYVWGFIHVFVVKPLLNGAEWVTESTARSAVAAVLYFTIRHFS